MRVVYEKDCKCRHAPASTGAIRFHHSHDPKTDSWKVRATFYPQPSCDDCGKAWRFVESSSGRK